MMDQKSLLDIARAAYARSYAPYSNFRVGAALVCGDGAVYTGCNIENVCGTSVCAERVAFFKAISEGRREFKCIAVACDQKDICFPCGFCLQTMAEFASELEIIVSEGESYRLEELLPHAFKG
jgi:cytidine deaminase